MESFETFSGNIAELEIKHQQAFSRTEKAVCRFPERYIDIRQQVDRILTHPLDIGEYFDVAEDLADKIRQLGKDTLFYPYFFENIHPGIKGRAKYFRATCRDLKHLLQQFSDYRRRTRHMRLVR